MANSILNSPFTDFVGKVALGAVAGAVAGTFVGGPVGAGVGAACGALGGATNGIITTLASKIFNKANFIGTGLTIVASFLASSAITMGISTAMGAGLSFAAACVLTAATSGIALGVIVGAALIGLAVVGILQHYEIFSFHQAYQFIGLKA